MLRQGPEHQHGWFATFKLGDQIIKVEARHVTHQRLARGSALMTQMARGKTGLAPETLYEWVVLGAGRQIGTLKQYENGTFYSGHLLMPRLSILEAAEFLALRRAPHLASRKSVSALDGHPDPSPSTRTKP